MRECLCQSSLNRLSFSHEPHDLTRLSASGFWTGLAVTMAAVATRMKEVSFMMVAIGYVGAEDVL